MALFFSLLFFAFTTALWAENIKPTVFVSIVPQKYFVQQISKGLFSVEVMVQPGASPATYEPKPSQMAKLAASTAYLAIGVPFETVWLARMSAVNPQMQIIHTDRGIEKLPMARHHHEKLEEGHSQEAHTEHDGSPQTILDPHIWLSPRLVKQQAAVILEALTSILPERREELDLNYRNFIQKIDGLDKEIRSILKANKGMRFMVFHPSWGYFAKEYGIEQVPIEIEGKTPKPAQLIELIHFAKEKRISVILVQPQFSEKSARVVAKEIAGEVVFADPLAAGWLENLHSVAEKISRAAQ